MVVWRVGYFASPCEFTPHELCGWNHRFDDPKREYRTIYAADKKETCLREVLADLRPNKKALADFEKIFGADDAPKSAGRVTPAWRRKHVLVQAGIELSSGKMADIETAAVLGDLSDRLEEELKARRLKRLDLACLRGKDRGLTRAASRLLYDDGHSGIRFRSRLDEVSCHALFEGRARLRQIGTAIQLKGDVAELSAVCGEYGLKLN
jgi:hypothetical protein